MKVPVMTTATLLMLAMIAQPAPVTTTTSPLSAPLPLAALAPAPLEETGPVAIVKAPAEVDPGDLLKFDATGSIGKHRTWQVHWYGGDALDLNSRLTRIKTAVELLESENFTVIASQGAEYDVVDDGYKLYVPSKPGRQYVVFFSTGDDAGIASTLARSVVRDRSPPPPPPNDDDDDDDPPPPPPPDDDDDPPQPPPPLNVNLGSQALEWLRCVPASARSEVLVHPTTGERVTRQRAVGRVYREVGDVTADLGAIEAADQMLGIGLQPAFGSRANEWKTFAAKADDALDKLRQQGATPAQYGQALRSIGVALEQ